MKYVVRFKTRGGGRSGYMIGQYSEVARIDRAKMFDDINKAHTLCHQCIVYYPTYLHWVEEIR